MNSATHVPVIARRTVSDLTRTFPAMAAQVTVRVCGDRDPQASVAAVAGIFAEVERQCTRFDPGSDLMRANALGDSWVTVGDYCYEAVLEASRAYVHTDRWFDPRVLRVLTELGYDRSLRFGDEPARVERPTRPTSQPVSERAIDRAAGPTAGAWRPDFDSGRRAIRVGPDPVDLGGIGKGLAVRWAAERLSRSGSTFLVEAGGDCYLGGDGPAGAGWQVGVQDPRGGSDPIAVLSVSDTGCATSSIRVRRWTVGDRPVHHLIDPHTGRPAQAGLASVTVLHPDPARAEVWSKVLFLQGAAAIARSTESAQIAAVWVDDHGNLAYSPAARPAVVWTAR